MELQLPLKNISINQKFGSNYLDFYEKLGLAGHNGIDMRARDGFECRASTDGIISYAGTDSGGGVSVEIWDKNQNIKTLYYHLKDYCVKQGKDVKAGQVIGRCDNTGIYTTGDHLHFGLKEVDKNGNTINYNNGYKGAIDPAPYFVRAYDGTEIKQKDYNASNAYHRYFRKDKRNYAEEVKVLTYLIKYLKRMPTVDQINMAVYGGWDKESIENIAMYNLCAYLKKSEYKNGSIPFMKE